MPINAPSPINESELANTPQTNCATVSAELTLSMSHSARSDLGKRQPPLQQQQQGDPEEEPAPSTASERVSPSSPFCLRQHRAQCQISAA
mmetsp:Transcript_50214/g.144435  ORF Transcript_50214/g.144435 Transcript_50214/m.144435 type:complete len:90 (-) Transcript_50214:163-432(-)